MRRERAKRIAVRGLRERALFIGGLLIVLPVVLTACESLPGFGDPQPVAAAPQPVVAPPPPPARPRAPSAAGQRFRSESPMPPPPPAAASDVVNAPAPPPDAPPPTIRAETPPRAAAPAQAPLAGDSAATDVARTEPAATPPAQSPQPPPPSIDPASLLGATAAILRDRFGAPDSQAPIASGMSWRYERAACTASFVLLPELTSGALRVFSYEITPREGAMFGPAGCLGRIAAPRGSRAAGGAP